MDIKFNNKIVDMFWDKYENEVTEFEEGMHGFGEINEEYASEIFESMLDDLVYNNKNL